MAERIVIPREGQGMESAVINEWFVKPGDEVNFGDELCEVESEKASFPIEAAVSGTVLAICYETGDTAPVLETIAVIGKPGEDFEHLLPGAASRLETNTNAAAPDPQAPLGRSQQQQPTALKDSGKRRISPRAKRLAATHGIDIGEISADPIRERDVSAYIGKKITALDFGEKHDGLQTVPFTNVRRIIADKMFTSVQSSAQFTLHSFADVTTALKYHRLIKNSDTFTNRITLNDLFLFVTARTLSQYPELNAHFDQQRYVLSGSINLGMAVDVPGGLMVPVIKNAQSLRLEEMARASAAVIEQCKSGKIKPDELAGGTFTLSNLGPMGIEHFTPILNYPEVAILGVGGIFPRPFRIEEGIEYLDCVALSLTINHQVVDGATGAKFLQTFAENAANIDLLLAM
ncbi:MAG: 2-oxo acid dehydrogenase subunit E2 [Spirochaetales bacterium]|nr:2-oxo acid dehydrogenase subunit E2 [Spirochaetales bacterium]